MAENEKNGFVQTEHDVLKFGRITIASGSCARGIRTASDSAF
jgi:hypothetical protein